MSSNETMLGAFFVPGNDSVVLKRVPIPTPAADEVLLEIKARHGAQVFLLTEFSAVGSALTEPFILGHEFAGVPVRLGSDVDATEIRLGQLYVVNGDNPCIRGITILPSPGLGANGGYAEYAVIKAVQLVPVPEGLPAEIACLAGDASTTASHAVLEIAKVQRGYKVLIFGIGGLGLQAVQLCVELGATVYAVDIKPSSRKLAVEAGAKEAFDPVQLDQRISKGDFNMDITIDFVSKGTTFGLAFKAVQTTAQKFGRAPRMLIVGAASDTLSINSTDLLASEVQILTSLYGSLSDIKRALDLLAKGVLKPIVQTVPLEKTNDAITDLRAGKVKNRKVVIPSTAASSFQWKPTNH
ncbi:GroES-like protein [Atractiella rhizophila]|nr:GroES-like protein [Atractiella rhizophila]